MADDDFERPALPAELTKKNWDKKKGKIAKMAGKTGMGDAFSKVEKAYKSVDWDKLEMISNKPRPFDLKKWNKMRDDAVGETKGNLGKLRTQCYALRDLAKKTEAKFSKNKAIPKSSAALCGDIAKKADFMGVGCNPSSMGTRIVKMYKSGRYMFDFTAQGIAKTAPSKVTACLASLKELESDPTLENWKANHMMTRARDVNQYMGNVSKLIKAGYNLPLNAGQCDKLFKIISPYASKDEGPLKDDATAQDVKKEIARLRQAMLAAQKVFSSGSLRG